LSCEKELDLYGFGYSLLAELYWRIGELLINYELNRGSVCSCCVYSLP